MEEFKAEQTGENIAERMKILLKGFGIKMKDVIFVTDRGGNFFSIRFSIFLFLGQHSNITNSIRDFSGNLKAAFKEPHIRSDCAAHLLNNIVQEMLGSPKVLNSVATECISHCRDLAKFVKRAKLNSKLKKTVKRDVISRWNSVYEILQSILDAWDTLEKLLPESNSDLQKSINKGAYLFLIQFISSLI